ncbi:Tat pathway signal sequence domain protein [Phenylobacterium terrae]|uniref:Tat pathway signal sequence domain protein n=1 Tax=Phenylobacterium terrae TaxID=2665495 RepID=A0ABW4N1T4_9CAUL
MSRPLLLAAAFAAALTTVSFDAAEAQSSRRQDQQQEQQREEAAKKRRSAEEWGDSRAPLPQLRNAGPCPYVKVLYDAARYIEFEGGREASAAVGYSGEIQGVSAECAYKDDEPIRVSMEILFDLGKGPTAQGSSKTYRYWIAVTKRNDMVIDKQYFDLPVNFPAGQNRIYATETIDRITIPRAQMTTSGANFEVLVGFDVTPQMAEFNRAGKRFRVNAGSDVAAGGSTSGQ